MAPYVPVRYKCAFPVTLRKRSGALELLSSEVSYRDVFVRTLAAPPQSSLVRLDLILPPDDTLLSLSACVEEVVAPTPDAERYPGFVARLVGLSGPPKKRWDDLIQWLRDHHPSAKDSTVHFERRTYRDRVIQRRELSLDLPYRPASVTELRDAIASIVSSQKLTVPTPRGIILGAPVDVELLHPLTEDSFVLPGVVRRWDAGASTVDVRLEPPSEDDVRLLEEFVDSVVVSADYDDADIFSGPVLSARSRGAT